MTYIITKPRPSLFYYNVDAQHTGNNTQTIVSNILIPANSVGSNNALYVEQGFYKVGAGGTCTWTTYLSSNSNNIVGASVLYNAINTATNLSAQGHRTIVNKNSQNSNYAYMQTGGVENSWLNSNLARVAINKDFANDLYIITTVQLGLNTDIGGVDFTICKIF